jgi:hypothetical protein
MPRVRGGLFSWLMGPQFIPRPELALIADQRYGGGGGGHHPLAARRLERPGLPGLHVRHFQSPRVFVSPSLFRLPPLLNGPRGAFAVHHLNGDVARVSGFFGDGW